MRGFVSVTALMLLDFSQHHGMQAVATLLKDAGDLKCHDASVLLLKTRSRPNF